MLALIYGLEFQICTWKQILHFDYVLAPQPTPTAHTHLVIIPYYCMSTYNYGNDCQSFRLNTTTTNVDLYATNTRIIYYSDSIKEEMIIVSPSATTQHTAFIASLGPTSFPS